MAWIRSNSDLLAEVSSFTFAAIDAFEVSWPWPSSVSHWDTSDQLGKPRRIPAFAPTGGQTLTARRGTRLNRLGRLGSSSTKGKSRSSQLYSFPEIFGSTFE